MTQISAKMNETYFGGLGSFLLGLYKNGNWAIISVWCALNYYCGDLVHLSRLASINYDLIGFSVLSYGVNYYNRKRIRDMALG